MPAAYSEDLRIRLIEAVKAGTPAREAGRMFLVGGIDGDHVDEGVV